MGTIKLNMKKALCVAPLGLAMLASSFSTEASVAISDKITLSGDLRLRSEDYNYNYKTDSDRSRLRLRVGATIQATDTLRVKFRLRNNAANNDSSHDTLGADKSADFGYDQAYVSYTGIENLTLEGGKLPFKYFRTTELYLEDTQIPEGASASYKAGNITVNAAHYIIDETRNGADTDLSWDHLQLVYALENLTLGLGHIALSENNSVRLGGEYEASEMTTFTAKAKMGKATVKLDAIATNEDATTDFTGEGQAYILGVGYQFSGKLAASASYWRVGQFGTLANGEFTQTDMHALENFEGVMLQAKYKVAPGVTVTPRYFYSETLDDAVVASVQDDGSAKSAGRYQINLDVKF